MCSEITLKNQELLLCQEGQTLKILHNQIVADNPSAYFPIYVNLHQSRLQMGMCNKKVEGCEA
jgi:hypothetical protein